MRDDEKAGVGSPRHLVQQVAEAGDVRIVERRIDPESRVVVATDTEERSDTARDGPGEGVDSPRRVRIRVGPEPW